ncbi:MAG: type II toxin-antitoxin system RelB/DinJ family antitoxin [Ruminococcus sp.]|nr:type II toxin-antitoxin system RelB/DinJ family antitoxin [Ruminococcus sp.]
MAQTTISARIDENDKVAFDRFCDDVGLSTSAAISIFVKAVLRERRIPFEITQSSDPFYSISNQEHLMKSIRELREGKGTAHELIEVDDE